MGTLKKNLFLVKKKKTLYIYIIITYQPMALAMASN